MFVSLVHLQWKPLRLLVRGVKLMGVHISIDPLKERESLGASATHLRHDNIDVDQ